MNRILKTYTHYESTVGTRPPQRHSSQSGLFRLIAHSPREKNWNIVYGVLISAMMCMYPQRSLDETKETVWKTKNILLSIVQECIDEFKNRYGLSFCYGHSKVLIENDGVIKEDMWPVRKIIVTCAPEKAWIDDLYWLCFCNSSVWKLFQAPENVQKKWRGLYCLNAVE